MKRKICVCMATYNGELYIKEQLTSILMQLRDFDSIVISDDHSTDSTCDIIKSFKDNRITLINNSLKHGSSYNFQNSLLHAKGDIYILSDQDDVWLPNRVQMTLTALADNDFCVCNSKIVDKDLNVINESRFAKYSIKKGFFRNLVKTRYIGCCFAFTRRVYDLLFPFPTNANIIPHDFWITLIGEFYFNVNLIDEPLMLYRRHENNVSNGGEKSNRRLITKVYSRFYCCFWIFISLMRKKNSYE